MDDCFRVVEQDWDILIVLDALRYDYFKAVYTRFFEGSLEPVYSCGSATPEWFYNNFALVRHSDIVYVSANPYINSRTCTRSYVRGLRRRKLVTYCARSVLGRIVDVWLYGFDERLGCVPPERMSIEALKTITGDGGGKRYVVHYIQPHVPFIGEPCECKILSRSASGGLEGPAELLSLVHHVFFTELLDSNPPLSPYRLLLSLLGVNPEKVFDPRATQLDYCLHRHGCRELRRCYLSNLLRALRALTSLVRDLIEMKYRVVITSDHGEALCDHGSIEHWNGSRRRVLRIVPWLRVKSVRRVSVDTRYILAKRLLERMAARRGTQAYARS